MESLPDYDRSKRFLGRLCVAGHDWHGTGQSLRFIKGRNCIECLYEGFRKRHPSERPLRTPRLPNGSSVEERFWSKVRKTATCWLWIPTMDRCDYGSINVGDGHWVAAHRLSYELHIGAIPAGMWVLHSCDMPPCVNPAHLFLGTNQDNVADMCAKGRNRIGYRPRGEENNKARLTEEDVRLIRSLRSVGVGPTKLGKLFGVSRQSIRCVVVGKTWRHVA